METKVEKQFPCHAQSVAESRYWLRSQLPSMWTLNAAEDALAVISEAVTNAVLHSGCRGDQMIDVVLQQQGSNEYELVIRDRGAFQERAAPRSNGGYGLILIDEWSNGYQLDKQEDGTVLTIQLRGPSAEDLVTLAQQMAPQSVAN